MLPVDGFGNQLFMDDSNAPSLLSLAHTGYVARDDPLYLSTRSALLSPANPFYASGTAGNGTGGPHVGPGWIWPMSIAMRAYTRYIYIYIYICTCASIGASLTIQHHRLRDRHVSGHAQEVCSRHRLHARVLLERRCDPVHAAVVCLGQLVFRGAYFVPSCEQASVDILK